MTNAKYDEIIRLTVYLFEHTDTEVIEFGDPSVKISRKNYNNILRGEPSFQNPNIQIINNLSTQVNIDNKTFINNIMNQLREDGKSNPELRIAEKKLNELNNELQKRRPKWDKIKKIIIWALDYGKDFFVQLLPLFLKTGSNI
ncbi:MAG: hypothetical protein E3J56_16190 [Candidatus Aminicenantes bacterium]|nr:MAG: hypothetical protein E3J56_16190 [Candidatus Aminicenantes bacterium]